MNIGWELPGMNIGQMKIRNLSLIANNNPTSVQKITDSKFEFSLVQNYPNPFNPSTTIKYSISIADENLVSTTNVTLKVYNTLGREVTTLVNKEQTSGNYEVIFDATKFSSGVYYYKLSVDKYSKTKKLLIMK
jgi:hypothetical protein